MVDLVFGMLNRVAPQLNAYQLAMGIKALAGIAFLFFAMSLTVNQMGVLAGETVQFIVRLINLMG
jgi:flagellar biosynthesis protein FliR